MSSIVSPTIVLAEEARALRPRLLATTAVAAMAGGAMPWLVAGWPVAVAAPISVSLALVIGAAARRAGLIGSRYRVAAGWWLPDGSWQLHLADGRVLTARLDPGTRALPGLWFLVWHSAQGKYFRLSGRRRGDCAHDARRLAVRLRMEWAGREPDPARPA